MYNQCQRGLNVGPLFLLIALVFFLVPPVLVGSAWKSFRKDSTSLVGWRRAAFSRALTGTALNIAVGFAFFLVHNLVLPAIADPDRGKFVPFSVFLVERVVEWTGAIFSAVSFVLAFSGIGKARICVLLAAFCNFVLWVATL
jgi:hypothetical protein